MGLDMYLVSSDKHLEAFEVENREKREGEEEQEQEIGYWRKHNRLHGWFEQKWLDRHPDTDEQFNCLRYYLSREDLDEVIEAIKKNDLPATQGFFFGNDSYEDDDLEAQKKEDIEVFEKAKKELENGRHVFYSSWW